MGIITDNGSMTDDGKRWICECADLRIWQRVRLMSMRS